MASIWRLNEDAVGERFTVAGVEFDATEIECARPANIV